MIRNMNEYEFRMVSGTRVNPFQKRGGWRKYWLKQCAIKQYQFGVYVWSATSWGWLFASIPRNNHSNWSNLCVISFGGTGSPCIISMISCSIDWQTINSYSDWFNDEKKKFAASLGKWMERRRRVRLESRLSTLDSQQNVSISTILNLISVSMHSTHIFSQWKWFNDSFGGGKAIFIFMFFFSFF